MPEQEREEAVVTNEAHDFAIANATDCPSCEASTGTHIVNVGDAALRGDGVYCGVCETFIGQIEA